MDNNEVRDESAPESLFEEIQHHNDTNMPQRNQNKQPVETKKETNTETQAEDDLDAQDFRRESDIKTEEEVEPSKETQTENAQTGEVKSEETPVEFKDIDWKATLPPAPIKPELVEPQYDPETGQLTNMTPQQFMAYTVAMSTYGAQKATYEATAEVQALQAAEQILPEIKTNEAIRKMVMNTRVASIMNGEAIDSYEAAKQVREALGISPTKLAEAKAEGANNAKVHIEVQKQAAIGQPSTSGQDAKKTSSDKKFMSRLKRGDDSAMEELLSGWLEEGKI